MGKRAATKAAAAAERPAKAAKAAQGSKTQSAHAATHPAEPADPFAEELRPVLQLLDQARDLPETCRAMLAGMAPHCLASPKEHRHKYQEAVVDVLKRMLEGVEAERLKAVESAQSSVDEAVAEQGPAEEASTKASQAVLDHAVVLSALEKERIATSERTVAARQALAETKAAGEDRESRRAQTVSDKEEYEKLRGPQLEELKSHTIPGRQWRLRDQKIQELVEALQQVGAEASVCASLPVALKAKPQERRSFAERVIAYAEDLLAQHVAKLDERLAAFESEAAEHAQKVSEAEAHVKAAAEAEEQAINAWVEKENARVELEDREKAAQRHVKELGKRIQRESETLRHAHGELAHIQELAAKFFALRDRSAVKPEEPKAEEAKAEEPKLEEAKAEEAKIEEAKIEEAQAEAPAPVPAEDARQVELAEVPAPVPAEKLVELAEEPGPEPADMDVEAPAAVV